MTKRETNKILNQVDSTGYLSQICNQNPYIILRTQCGTGRYSFQNISYKNEELVLEFKLIKDDKYGDIECSGSELRPIERHCSAYMYSDSYGDIDC